MEKRRGQNGFTTLEAVIGLLLVGGALFAISSFVEYSGRAQVGIEQSSQLYELVGDIKAVLSSEDQCSQNFSGLDPTTVNDMGQPAATPHDLQNFAVGGSSLAFAGDGKKYRDLVIVSAGLRRDRQIASNLYLMYYEAVVAKSGKQSLGAQQLTARVPFSALIDASTGNPTSGKVVRCFTDPFSTGTTAVEQFFCMTQSSGSMVYDPTTQACVSKFAVTSYPGTMYAAGPCPTGSTFQGCTILNGNSSGSTTTTQTYHKTGSQTVSAPGTKAYESPTGSSQCVCDYSTSYIPSGTETCAVQCGALKTELVHIWPTQPSPN